MQDLATLDWSTRPSYATRNLDELQRHFRELDRKAVLEVSQPALFDGYSESFIQLGQIALSMTEIASPEGYQLGFRPRTEYCLNVPLKGQGWVTGGPQVVEVSTGQAVFIAPTSEIQKHWLGPSKVLTVHIPLKLLHDDPALEVASGLPPLAVFDCAGMGAFFDLIGTICTIASDTASPLLHPSVTEHLERALLALLIRLLPIDRTDTVRGASSPAVPYYIRRAEHYMRANFRPGLSLDDIAAAAGVSRRTLQYGFKTFHDMTPMHYFKRMRLSHARGLLSSGGLSKSLNEFAWDNGYQNSSHFTSDYRAMFGETPSRTAARAGGTIQLMGNA